MIRSGTQKWALSSNTYKAEDMKIEQAPERSGN